MPRPTPVTPTQDRWIKAAEEEQFTALSSIRKSAEKWAGTVGTLTGVFSIAALIKGNSDLTKLTDATQYWVGGILALALLCAFLAILLAALAAQGVPAYFSAEESPHNDPDKYQEHYLTQVAPYKH